MRDQAAPQTSPMVNGIRVGFVLSQVLQLGIRNYLANLFAAIATLPGNSLQPIVFTGYTYGDEFGAFPDVWRVRSKLLDRRSVPWILRKVLHRIFSRDVLLERLLRREGIRVLSHSAPLGKRSGLRTIGWIADLQHMRLPTMFTAGERSARDSSFTTLCEESDTILVSSHAGLEDLRMFSPVNANKGRVLHFVSAAANVQPVRSLDELEAQYGFKGPYLLLPNQFWPHKNHQLVVDALQWLRERGKAVLVLCTGSTKGPEDTAYFPDLMKRAQQAGVEDSFRVLGIVPFADLSSLMLHAAALLNPSRFEGWSTSVEESKSLGKTILLSDIPVHREQDPEYGIFFSPDDAPDLAKAMLQVMANHSSVTDQARSAEANEAFPERRALFGRQYLHLVQQSVQ